MSGPADPVVEATARAHARHDLAHQLATLGALVAAAADPDLDVAGRGRVLDSAREELAHASDLLVVLAGGTPVDASRRSTDLAEVLVTSVAAQPAHRVELRVPGGATSAVEVALDRTSTLRVVRNLLGNALAAAGPSGRVLLDLTVDDSATAGSPLVRLAVHDDGPGPGLRGFSRAGGSGLDVVRSQVLPAGGWLVLGRSPLGGALATVVLPGTAP